MSETDRIRVRHMLAAAREALSFVDFPCEERMSRLRRKPWGRRSGFDVCRATRCLGRLLAESRYLKILLARSP
jgi:hypothetical protein